MFVGHKTRVLAGCLSASLLIHGFASWWFEWYSGVGAAVAVPVPSRALKIDAKLNPVLHVAPPPGGHLSAPKFVLGDRSGFTLMPVANGVAIKPAGVKTGDKAGSRVYRSSVAVKSTESAEGEPPHSDEPSFLPTSAVDREALALSNVDIPDLDLASLPRGETQFRLFIDAQGRVVSVQILSAAADGHEADYSKVIATLQAISFIPAIKDRIEVASFLDIAMDVGGIAPTVIVQEPLKAIPSLE